MDPELLVIGHNSLTVLATEVAAIDLDLKPAGGCPSLINITVKGGVVITTDYDEPGKARNAFGLLRQRWMDALRSSQRLESALRP